MEDHKIWFTVDEFPAEATPILVLWKTGGPFPQKVEDAYEISDAFWFAEVAAWRYYELDDESLLDTAASKVLYFDDEDLVETEEIERPFISDQEWSCVDLAALCGLEKK